MKLTLLMAGWYELVNDYTGVAIAVCAFEISECGVSIEVDPDPTQTAPAITYSVHAVNSISRRIVQVPRCDIAVEFLP